MAILDMFRPEGRSLLICITVSCGLGFMLFGYDQGVFGGLLANPSFLDQFNQPSVTLQGQIVSTYTLGCIVGSIIAIFTGAHMIIGRILSGLGIGFNTTTIPIWQSETCLRPSLRGKLVAIELVCLIFGFVLTNWMNFGFTYMPTSQVSWRFPLGFQALLAVGTAIFIPFLVESPRWLCLKDRHEDARAVLARLHAKPIDSPEVRETLEIIIETIAEERADGEIGWRDVFHNGRQQTFRRILLGLGVSIFQQLGGINVVAYYLPVVLERSFGFSPRMALILSATASMNWMFWGAMNTLAIERVGRKNLMIFGATGCSVCFAVTAIGLGIGSKVSNGVAVAFIFMFYVFFVRSPEYLSSFPANPHPKGTSFMTIAFLYPSEINGNRSRNLGAAVAMVTNWMGVYLVVSITPIGIQNLGWRFYIVFAVLNAAFLPFIWFFYVETAGLSLDEIDRVFVLKHAEGSTLTYKQATEQAKEQLEIERLEISARPEKSVIADHVESVA
ncbi:hypothetical protein LTR91_002431 [Friedmanniomyces endolithicus]|uniref:Major facilitator superfamily (MFS) profile domain-containing protein n=1 Tax=Friedmanniomyces endolithicus TaxID=329885 RepID=A0AAN6L0G5_9PEZI|nr:hypothetical protein LTR35_010800 [Friedmanniomyces endolithicus]KAK0292478.1 hypothetical protein LTS00_007955 [Friedmanniomyces endolithicus]KAK0998423.1 hypothetical protein LTR54_009561 [Friedmanniomyces endolithicus]KAK1008512.1 hypothetical protein LTS01_002270 [Friedmanniomyces endolithicus]KAK1010596.1 hypothetical protein LTR91_002431 [Friedmanniomyces endolithicus]